MTPDIAEKDKETRYMIVNSQIQKDDNKEIIQRKIKLILVNHDHKQGIPYSYQMGDEKEEEDDEPLDKRSTSENRKGRMITKQDTMEGRDSVSNERGDIQAPRNLRNQAKKAKPGCCSLDKVRTMVSTNKNRMVVGGFNLDLTYITNRIIACGFPAEGFEGMFRNKKEDLIDFFKLGHSSMVKIYNLCAEKAYEYDQKSVAPFSISKFPFPDHNVGSMKTVYEFCLDACLFLQRMEQYTYQLKKEGKNPFKD